MSATAMKVLPGTPFPLDATFEGSATNFAVFSEIAERIELCLFDGDGREARINVTERDAYNWHVNLTGVGPGQLYGYRVHAPWDPKKRLRCCPNKLLLDPNCRAVYGTIQWSDAMFPYPMDRPWYQGRSLGVRPSSTTLAGSGRNGSGMSESDWKEGYIKSLQVFLNGDLGYVDKRGEPVLDDDFLVLFNADCEDIFFRPALFEKERPWEILLNTSTRIEDGAEGQKQAEGMEVKAEGRSVVVLTRPRK